jgi:esterase/lipase superfamily enzyme
MFVVTNRNLIEGAHGVEGLGPKVNPMGPAELRMLEAVPHGQDWEVRILPDVLTDAMKQEVGIEDPGRVFASQYVFRRLLALANPKHANPSSRKKGRDIVLYVHGFNNSFADVLDRCRGISEQFDVEVVAFTWPANGGGAKGILDYLEDKRDAQASVVALDRVLEKSREMLVRARSAFLDELAAEAIERFPESGEKQREFIARKADQQCPFRVSLFLHSMGNYLFERTLKSSALRGDQLVFDNILMVAADVNNPGHAEWVEKIQVRNRLYIAINEDDYALRASRMKGGDEQLARLGHYPYNLTAKQAVYVDFTDAPHVGQSHAYFEGAALKNDNVRRFFDAAVHGLRAEDAVSLRYDASRNLHRFG